MVGLEVGLHQLYPGILVGGVGAGREDRDLALVTDLLGNHVDLALGDTFGRGLVDEQVAVLRLGVGVEGDDLRTGIASFVERVTDGLGVIGRDDERIDALLGRGVDERHLAVGAGLLRSDLGELATELGDGLLAAGIAGVEVRVAQVLGQEGHRGGLA